MIMINQVSDKRRPASQIARGRSEDRWGGGGSTLSRPNIWLFGGSWGVI